MKSGARITVIIVALVTSVFATEKPKVSSYMRNVGLLYLEAVDSLTTECGRDPMSDCYRHWDSTMDSLEDRITIAISEKNPAGDARYFQILQRTRHARDMYALSLKDTQRAIWGHAYAVCYGYTHTVALYGELIKGEGDCDAALETATKDDK
jgi:hypothetical protein